MTENLLTAGDISFSYDSKEQLLSHVNIEVEPSRVTVLGGPNGSGKSTLLKILARQLKPSSGSVKLGGKDVNEMTPAEFAQKVAYVPQSTDITSHITVEELVMLGRNPHQPWWSWHQSQVDRNAVTNALERTDMTKLKSRHVANLSGGEMKRAMIATALAQETNYLLLDEPVAHLDFKHQLSLLSLISELKERNLAILIVLHDLNMIERIADRVSFLKKSETGASQLAFSGTRDEVLIERTIADVFQVNVSILNDSSQSSRVFSIESVVE